MAVTRLIGVSGLSGLIGSELAQVISDQVHLVPSQSFSTISLDSIDSEIERLSKQGVTGFLHLAWPAASTDENYKTSLKNFGALEKTIEVKRSCDKWGVGFFGVGTGIDKSIDHDSNYSIAKFEARKAFLEDIIEKRVSWIRPHYVFNGKDWPRFIYLEGEELPLIQDNTPRDWVHIKDVASGIMKVLELDLKGEVDIGSGLLIRPSELCDALDIKFSISESTESHPGINEAFVADLSPLSLVSWEAKHTLEIFR